MADVDLDHSCTLNKKIRNAQLAQYNFILGNLSLYFLQCLVFFFHFNSKKQNGITIWIWHMLQEYGITMWLWQFVYYWYTKNSSWCSWLVAIKYSLLFAGLSHESCGVLSLAVVNISNQQWQNVKMISSVELCFLCFSHVTGLKCSPLLFWFIYLF